MLNERKATIGIGKITDALKVLFLYTEIGKWVEYQRKNFDQFPNGGHDHLTSAQKKAKLEGRPFEPDMERAKDYANQQIEFGVGQRLKGAFTFYQVGMQLECIRHILLALDALCCILNWDKASAYLNQQNHVLLEMKKQEKDA